MVYLNQILDLIYIVQPLVCKTVARLPGEFKTKKTAENHKIYVKLKNMQIEIINIDLVSEMLHDSQVCTIITVKVRLSVQFGLHTFLLAPDTD